MKPSKHPPTLDAATMESIVAAVVRRIEARRHGVLVEPEWLPVLGHAQKHGVSRATMWRVISAAREAVRKRKLSRKLVLFHCGDVDRLMEKHTA
jgi:predicted DNA-binding protein (UPF0251 family)